MYFTLKVLYVLQMLKFVFLHVLNVRNIFLEKSYTKYGREKSPTLFSKESLLTLSLNQLSEISYSLLLLYIQVEDYQNILKLRYWSLAFTTCKAFLRKKRRPRTSLLELISTSFSIWFLKKNIFHAIFCYLKKFHRLIVNTCQYMYCNYLFLSRGCHKFWN